jgi:hypothetical protein
VSILAEVVYNAFRAFRLAGFAGVAAMQDQPVMRVLFEFVRRQAHQALFNFERSFSFGNTSAVGHPEYVSIDRDCRLAESGIQNNIGRFSADAGQGLEFLACTWHLAVEAVNQYPTGLDNIFCFAVKKADCPDVGFKFSDAKVEYCLRRIRDRIQKRRRLVDADIGITAISNSNGST